LGAAVLVGQRDGRRVGARRPRALASGPGHGGPRYGTAGAGGWISPATGESRCVAAAASSGGDGEQLGCEPEPLRDRVSSQGGRAPLRSGGGELGRRR